jgi:CDP-L-myo-inositol myo-inositolphosphotransferase
MESQQAAPDSVHGARADAARAEAPVEHAVIIAAGSGARFGETTQLCPKPLLEVLGVPLILRAIHSARQAGVRHFTVVTGYHAEVLERFLGGQHLPDITIQCVRNEHWQRPNGLSVLAARGRAAEPFLLLMADHLFDPKIVRLLTARALPPGCCRLAVDRRLSAITDLADATKVQLAGERIVNIGKGLERYCAIDSGIFLCSHSLFGALERATTRGEESLSDGVRELATAGCMEAVDIGEAFWQDVDTAEDLAAGERRLLETLVSATDSWLTRKVNRRLSLAVTRRLARLPLLPNHITLCNFALGLLGAGCMLFGTPLGFFTGALLFLLSSILDGCDGELARLRYQQSPLGAWLDVTTDNVTHLALFGCLTAGLVRSTGSLRCLLPGSLLLLGALTSFVLSVVAHRRLQPGGGPLFSASRLQDVPGSAIRGRRERWLDRLANRDFAYLLLFLAAAGRVEWFLWIAGIGAPIFGVMLYRALATPAVSKPAGGAGGRAHREARKGG